MPDAASPPAPGDRLLRALAIAALLGLALGLLVGVRVVLAQSVPTAGVVLTANQQSADATLVSLADGASRRLPVGEGPHEAAIGADGAWGVVTVYGTRETRGTQLALVDLARGTVVRHVSLAPYTRPHGVVPLPGPGRRVVVTAEAEQRLLVVDLAGDSIVAAIPTGAAGSHMVAVTRDGTRAFTANVPAGSMSEIDLVAGRLVRQVPTAPMAEGIAVAPDGREAWVGSNQARTVSVVDVAAGRVVATIDGVGVPYRLAFAPDGRTVAVADPEGNAVHLVDVASRRVTGSVGGLGSPRGVVFAPDGRTVLATLGTEDAVAVLDVAARTVRARHAVGRTPDGVAVHAPR